MNHLITELTETLKEDERLVIDNKLAKNKVVELALALDEKLIVLLLRNETLKKQFFKEVSTVMVFDKVAFQSFVSNKQFLPDSYTAFKNKIGLTANNEYLTESNEVVLSWPYKDCVLEGGQTKEDQKRKEIFWNKTLAPDEIDRLLEPKALTNFKKYDQDGEHDVKDIGLDDNLIIKGNNLLALHSLKKQYASKVKLIYIDPPYNTGSDSFGYNDSFNHSTWLTFMRNRLEIAKDLLREDGVIVVHCDYIEDAYTKVLLDEVFGSQNFINLISIRDSHPSGLKLSAKTKTIIKTKSSVLVYKKSELFRMTPIYQKRDDWDTHFNTFVDVDSKNLEKTSLSKYVKINLDLDNFKLDKSSLKSRKFREFAFQNRSKIFQSTKELPADGKKLSLENPDVVVEYKENEFAYNGRRLSPLSKSIHSTGFDGFFNEDFSKLLCDFWDDIDFNNSQNEGGVSFPQGKKPELLLARMLTMFTNSGDVVLDYHLGSGTTCAVAHKMGRKYIGIEQLNYGENDSVVRLNNVVKGDKTGISKAIKYNGGGSFIYCELMQNNADIINRIEEAKTTKDLLSIWQSIKDSDFVNYKVKPSSISENVYEFEALSVNEQKQFLIEVLDKNQLYVNYSDIEDKDYQISSNDKELNRRFYGE
jgi:adenine-specific DNA-methyltransferase